MFAYWEYYVLSGRGLCIGLITHPDKSYRLWCIDVCDLETSSVRRPWPALGRRVQEKKIYLYRSLHATLAQSKNCPFGVNSTNELKGITSTTDSNGIWQVMF